MHASMDCFFARNEKFQGSRKKIDEDYELKWYVCMCDARVYAHKTVIMITKRQTGNTHKIIPSNQAYNVEFIAAGLLLCGLHEHA